ncbi:MAG: sulfatase [Proteobacteria bacterium]|nr:sulfatase [Pseudomonadota bacterium]MCP4921039.1 sulfatase [Pseudomonadota bacterium]
MTRLHSVLAAAAIGAAYVGLEALVQVVFGSLWLTSSVALVLPAMLLGGILAAPVGAIGARATQGLTAAAAVLALVELGLLVTIDAPPFQEAPWYVGNLALLVGGIVGIAAWVAAQRRVDPLGWAGLLVLALPLVGVEASSGSEVEGQGTNVLLVTLDTTRADHIGAYGYAQARTPNLDALAAEGTLYEAAFANVAVTGPSHTTLLGGRGTWSHGTLLNGIPVPDDERMLAEILSDEGYAAGAFVSAYVLDGDYGFRRGFGTYDDDFSGWKGSSGLLPRRIQAALVRRFSPDEVLERRGDRTTEDALDWLDEQDGPWFLWVHLFEPHGPYDPPAEYLVYEGDPRSPEHTSMEQVDLAEAAPYLRKTLEGITDLDYVMAAYDGEIAFADAQVGRLVEAAGPDTLVVVSGDHGESFGENGVWFDHGDDVYDASLRVPLIIRHPDLANGVDDRLVELDDVTPTVLDLLGLPAGRGLDGQSLRGTPRSVVRSLCYDRDANMAIRSGEIGSRPTARMAGLRSDDALFVRREHESFADAFYRAPEGEGFRLVTEEDVSAGEDLAVLVQHADELLSGDAERSAVELTDAERARLEALGYLE